MRKWLFLTTIMSGLAVSVFSGYLIFSVELREERASVYRSALADYEKERQVIAEIMQEISAGEFKEDALLTSRLATLSEVPRAAVLSFTAAKRVEGNFRKQERLLGNAGALLTANKNNPIAEEYLDRAKVLNDLNIAALLALAEIPGNCEWNARLHYLVGAIHYRSLVFVTKEEQFSASDIIGQAVRSFKKVFECLPKDRSAEVAIEMLYKQAKERDSGTEISGDELDRTRLKLLPKPQFNDMPGTGGTDREHGRY